MSQKSAAPRALMAGATDPGRVRTTNQDHFLVADLRRLMQICDCSLIDFEGKSMVSGHTGELLAVADGMGGYQHGEFASSEAVRHLASYVSHLRGDVLAVDQMDEADFRAQFVEIPGKIHRRLKREGQAHAEKAQMGTTLTAAYVAWPHCYILHVGDSRCYLWRDGVLRQLTNDHTVAQSMIDGGLPEEDIKNPTFHHMLWNSITAAEYEPKPDLICEVLKPGDSLLLCSDGLTRHLTSLQISEELQGLLAPVDKCHRLIDAANQRGGRDNITVVIAEFDDEAEAESAYQTDQKFNRVMEMADTAIM